MANGSDVAPSASSRKEPGSRTSSNVTTWTCKAGRRVVATRLRRALRDHDAGSQRAATGTGAVASVTSVADLGPSSR